MPLQKTAEGLTEEQVGRVEDSGPAQGNERESGCRCLDESEFGSLRQKKECWLQSENAGGSCNRESGFEEEGRREEGSGRGDWAQCNVLESLAAGEE